MANATVSYGGQVNGADGADALWLKLFGGEAMASFEETNVFLDKHMVRSISQGKSAQFPVHGRATASYHTPGAEITGQTIKGNERVITIDDLLTASVFIASLDEAKAHYDFRSIYSGELGRALSKEFDYNAARNIVLAARASTTVEGGNGGSVITDADAASNGASLAASIFEAGQKFDEKDVPENDRYAGLKPAQYSLLVQTTNVINRDWGGAGVYADGTVLKVAGIHIVKSNHIPQANDTSNTAIPSAYRANYSTTVAAVWQKDAIGTVKLMDLSMEAAYDIRRQGHLLVAKYAMGHGILRPECAVEIKSS